MKQLKLIGLTGLYCAGKNHLAALLEKRGLPVLDVDTLGHQALLTEKAAIIRRFGTAILGPGGEVDRRLLGKKVFGSSEELAALEAIVHPAANRLTETWIAGQSRLCVINAAVIHKSSVYERLDALIVVRAPFFVRLFRAWKRDRLPFRELVKRLNSQVTFPFRSAGNTQLFSAPADMYRVSNFPGTRRSLEKQIAVILGKISR
ncbi:dephospho-CoA kinase [Spirochaetia bacterium]|nr:dephospho-CoA kinase [Spirochaetia bacterium]